MRDIVKKSLSMFLILTIVFTSMVTNTTSQAQAATYQKELATTYLNTTTKYLYLEEQHAQTYNFNIKQNVQIKGATYSWYVKSDKGNLSSVSINKKTGVVTAQEAGTAYIRCKITSPKGKVVRPEAKVVVRNNITDVKISNMPENLIITSGKTYDFNRTILNTSAGKGEKTQGITRWEISDDTAGGLEATDNGIIYPAKEGKFKIRAVCFQSKEKYIHWLADKEAKANFITAASHWLTIKVASSNGKATVSNQEQLNKALADDSIYQIILSTNDVCLFIIPESNYTSKSLTVDAKNADMDNYGTFKDITIKAIKDNTWTEYADGNIIVVIDDTSSINVIGQPIEINALSGGLININILGNMDKLKIIVKNGSDIVITGINTTPIILEVHNEGSKITSSSPISILLNKDAGAPEILLIDGSGKSSVTAETEEQLSNILNKTGQDISTTVTEIHNTEVNAGGNSSGGSFIIPEQSTTKSIVVGTQQGPVQQGSIIQKAKIPVTLNNITMYGTEDTFGLIEYDSTGTKRVAGYPFDECYAIYENGSYYLSISPYSAATGTHYLRTYKDGTYSNLFQYIIGASISISEIKILNEYYNNAIMYAGQENQVRNYSATVSAVNSVDAVSDAAIKWCDASGNELSSAPAGLTAGISTSYNAYSMSASCYVAIVGNNVSAGYYYYIIDINGISSAPIKIEYITSSTVKGITVGTQQGSVQQGSITQEARFPVTLNNITMYETEDTFGLIEYDSTGMKRVAGYPFDECYAVFENGTYYLSISPYSVTTGIHYLRASKDGAYSNLFQYIIGDSISISEIKILNDYYNNTIMYAGQENQVRIYTATVSAVNSADAVSGAAIKWCDASGNELSSAPAGLTAGISTSYNAYNKSASCYVTIVGNNVTSGSYYYIIDINGISSAPIKIEYITSSTVKGITVGTQQGSVQQGSITQEARFPVTLNNITMYETEDTFGLFEYDSTGMKRVAGYSFDECYAVFEGGTYYLSISPYSATTGTHYLRAHKDGACSNLFQYIIGDSISISEIKILNEYYNNTIMYAGQENQVRNYTATVSAVNSANAVSGAAIKWCDASGNELSSAPVGLTAGISTSYSAYNMSASCYVTIIGNNVTSGIYYFKASINNVDSLVTAITFQ